jgi:hypothetical protein
MRPSSKKVGLYINGLQAMSSFEMAAAPELHGLEQKTMQLMRKHWFWLDFVISRCIRSGCSFNQNWNGHSL